MINLFETKLSIDDRKKLDSDMFGLPKERKYPLNDETRVRKAIQFFKFCPSKNRNELATNINKRLRDTGLKVDVGKDNPFYKYMNKDYLRESFIEYNELISSNICVDEDKLMKCILSVGKGDTKEICNRQARYNKEFRMAYLENIAFLKYNNENVSDLFYRVISDIIDVGYKLIRENNTIALLSVVRVLTHIAKEIPIDCRFMERELHVLIRHYRTYIAAEERSDINKSIVITELYDLLDILEAYSPHRLCVDKSYDSILMNYVMNGNLRYFSFPLVQEYLNTYKMEIENELYIIKSDSYMDGYKSITSDINSVSDVCKSIIERITNRINPNKLARINSRNYSQSISPINIVRISSMKDYINTVVTTTDIYGETIYCGDNDDTVYLILVNKDIDNELLLVELTDNCIEYLDIPRAYSDGSTFKVIRVEFVKKNNSVNKSLTEGFTIDEDGNMKITISPKKSYMDEYSQNHKLLVENWKNKNYEGVKKNLAFIFALINIIERDKRYKNREPEIVKARAFAINDFKTYLKKLTSIEKDFDFVKYYDESDYDKFIVDLPKQTILGIKMLFKAIIT